MIRVLIADDQALVRGALASMLRLEPDIDVVGEAGTGAEAEALALASRPDVLLIDIQMPGGDGIEVTAALARALPSCKVVICTTFGRPGYLTRAVAAGAVGFVVKDAPPEQLAEAVRRVASGLRQLDPALLTEARLSVANPLTPREREVLAQALTGATVAAIARAVSLSEGTVRNHVSSAMAKTSARTRAEAARIADEHGWL